MQAVQERHAVHAAVAEAAAAALAGVSQCLSARPPCIAFTKRTAPRAL